MRYNNGSAVVGDIHRTPRGDDMPSLSAWIKKLPFKRTRVFCHSCPKKNWAKTEDFL
jgi:hypothetical protein